MQRCSDVIVLVVLPLWTPGGAALGDIGYLDKPSGEFITLFSTLAPNTCSRPSIKRLSTMAAYGPMAFGEQRSEKRNVALRGLDALSGFLTFRTST